MQVSARRDLAREGDTPRFIYLLLDGWACRYKALPDGRRQNLAFLIPGELCNLHLLFLEAMDHSVAAVTGVEVAEIARDDFEALIARQPRILRSLYRDELVKIAIQREWTLNLGQRTAYERLAHLLCELFLRLDLAGLTRGTSCEFPLTQVDIAEATGLTAVHVNRTLQELRANGLVELKSRVLTIPNMAALQDAAMFNDNYLHLGRDGEGARVLD